MPTSTPVVPAASSKDITMDDDVMDGYGDAPSNARTTNGAVDFFSSLGTDIKKKKPQPDKPDPDKVRRPFCHPEVSNQFVRTAQDQPQRA